MANMTVEEILNQLDGASPTLTKDGTTTTDGKTDISSMASASSERESKLMRFQWEVYQPSYLGTRPTIHRPLLTTHYPLCIR